MFDRISKQYKFIPVYLCMLLPCYGLAQTMNVSSVQPAANFVSAPDDSAIAVEFDRAVDINSVTDASFWAYARWSGVVSGVFSFENGNQTVVLTPARPFSAGEQVTVILSNQLMGQDGTLLRDAGYSFQFWVRSSPAGLVFEEIDRMETGTPSRPYGGIATDLDEDGFLDITSVNEDTNDLRFFRNRADGSGLFDDFATPTSGTGSVPSPSEVGDFNRDGHMDIAVANTTGSTASILLGNGDGSFGPQQEIMVNGLPRGITVLDIDGDGDLDAATANRNTGTISLLENNGSGVFSVIDNFGTNGGEWSLAAGDMNNDGIMDLVAGGTTTPSIWVYAGDGQSGFTQIESQSSGGTAWMMVLGDVNNDGHIDVVQANGGADNGAVLLGDGTGQLGAPDIFSVDPTALATDLGDLDGDGDLDWMLASFGGDWALFENINGSFVFHNEFDAPAAASCSLFMDIDNDGSLDLALLDELANEIIILRNNGETLLTDGFESKS